MIYNGFHHNFLYSDLIEYRNTGDEKTPTLQTFPNEKCVENGVVSTKQGLERRSFLDLQYKKLLVKNIQTVNLQLRCKISNLVPFVGAGKVVLTLKFKKICIMA